MKELIRTNDLVQISYIQSILIEAGIQYKLLDAHTSAVEGSVNAIEMRIMVSDDNYKYSKNLIQAQSN